jgi:nucleotide-binding universal stress UspA family protein
MREWYKDFLYRRILFATDFSDASQYAMTHAVSIAKRCDAKLYIIHVIYDVMNVKPVVAHPSMDKFYEEMIKEAKHEMERCYREELRGFSNVEMIVKKGTPSFVVNDFARDNKIDLIVVATLGRTGLERLIFGNTCDKIIRRAPCPVLAVRKAEYLKEEKQ